MEPPPWNLLQLLLLRVSMGGGLTIPTHPPESAERRCVSARAAPLRRPHRPRAPPELLPSGSAGSSLAPTPELPGSSLVS